MKKKWVLRHCDLDLWPKVTKFNWLWASALSKRLAKTASKSVHPFGWNFVHKKNWTDTQTHTQTNCSENITPPRFRGVVIMCINTTTYTLWMHNHVHVIYTYLIYIIKTPTVAALVLQCRVDAILYIYVNTDVRSLLTLSIKLTLALNAARGVSTRAKHRSMVALFVRFQVGQTESVS